MADQNSFRSKPIVKPLIHLLTSPLAQSLTVNGVLCAGGSPILTECRKEAYRLKSAALLLNFGMWQPRRFPLYRQVCGLALKRGAPVVLDPVGAAFSSVRRHAALRLLKKWPGRIFLKGNGSEIIAMHSDRDQAPGVDNQAQISDALTAARDLGELTAGWLVTGASDWVGCGDQLREIAGGSPLLGRITASGCLFGGLLAFEIHRQKNYFDGACLASVRFKEAGRLAAQNCRGPGTFAPALLDCLAGQFKEK